MTLGTEAPAEMNTYFPQFKAMWMAENRPTRCTTCSRCEARRCATAKWASYLNENDAPIRPKHAR